MRTPILSVPLLIAANLITGCVSGTAPNAPSLMPRAIENRSDAVTVAPVVAVAPDPALDSRIAARVAAFDAAARAFDTARPSLGDRIARATGAAEGSERWLDGQSAIGELQQARTATDSAMADLEQLAIERAAAGSLPYPALDAAITAAQAELDRQAAIEAQLKASLRA